MNLHDYLSAERGRQARICKEIGAHAPDLSRWATGQRPVPVDKCLKIERATGGDVTRRDLRPNDWHEIWPDLITDEHPAPAPAADESAAQAAA